MQLSNHARSVLETSMRQNKIDDAEKKEIEDQHKDRLGRDHQKGQDRVVCGKFRGGRQWQVVC